MTFGISRRTLLSWLFSLPALNLLRNRSWRVVEEPGETFISEPDAEWLDAANCDVFEDLENCKDIIKTCHKPDPVCYMPNSWYGNMNL